MKHIALCIALIAGLVGVGHSVQGADDGKKSDQIVLKMRQLDLLNQIIPLALTKEQIGKLLPAVERARAKVKEIHKEEATTLAKVESKINDAIKKSIDTQVAPPKALLDELAQTTFLMGKKRLVVIEENTDSVLKVFNEVCNAGQKKAATNSLAPQLLDPSLDPKKMTETDKLRFFIQEIFLDPQAYDILLAVEKKAG